MKGELFKKFSRLRVNRKLVHLIEVSLNSEVPVFLIDSCFVVVVVVFTFDEVAASVCQYVKEAGAPMSCRDYYQI